MKINMNAIHRTTVIPDCMTIQKLQQAAAKDNHIQHPREHIIRGWQLLNQLHSNHMGIEKTRLLACKSIYWIGINADIETHIKTVQHIFNFSKCN